MKNIILVLCMAAGFLAHGQIVDGVNLAERKDINYLYINMNNTTLKIKPVFKCSVDWGQPRVDGNTYTILDEKGEPRVWLNDIELINYFAGFGWRFVMFVNELPGTGAKVHAFLFERRQ